MNVYRLCVLDLALCIEASVVVLQEVTAKEINVINMEKKVYCLIENRCKCIKFTPQRNVSEVEVIRYKLLEACKTDTALDMMLKNQMIILQKVDPDRGNKLCDIEDDDEIVDKSEVTVLLIPMRRNVNTASDSTHSFSSVDNNNASTIKVLCTVPIDSDDTMSHIIDIPESVCYLVSYNKYPIIIAIIYVLLINTHFHRKMQWIKQIVIKK